MNNFIKSVDVPEHLDLLKDFENINHESISNTLYKAKKSLDLVDQFTNFAACQKCHNKDDVTNIQ